MKLDLITNEVFTDSDEFIKKLNCPYKIDWDDLEIIDSSHRKCYNCNHEIVDTENFSDNELLSMIKHNPKTCFKISSNQEKFKNIL